jgi:hypothetical protein
MFWQWLTKRLTGAAGLFNGHFVDVKVLYAHEFNSVPCVTFIGELDTTKTYAFIQDQLGIEIEETFQHCYFDHQEQQVFFNNTILVLSDHRMIELGNNYCQVLHMHHQCAWAINLVQHLSEFRIVHQGTAIGFSRQTTMN